MPMPDDAFISYCSEDKKIADAVCELRAVGWTMLANLAAVCQS